jgi:uncharacterized membrane protein YfcA
MHIAGYISALFIGVALGLIGGGGSILTVPVLVYLFGIEPTLATAYSLFVVGSTSLIGVVPKYMSREIDWRAAAFFGIPSILTVFLVRSLLVPQLPQTISIFGWVTMSKSVFIMVFFALLMFGAAVSMIRYSRFEPDVATKSKGRLLFILLGLGTIVGLIAGLVGAGGGFLIIPVLVFFAGLSMKKAIGTSLLIIAAQSLLGFSGDMLHIQLDWPFLLVVTGIAVSGLLLGIRFGKNVAAHELKKGFGWFVLGIALYVLFKELLT